MERPASAGRFLLGRLQFPDQTAVATLLSAVPILLIFFVRIPGKCLLASTPDILYRILILFVILQYGYSS